MPLRDLRKGAKADLPCQRAPPNCFGHLRTHNGFADLPPIRAGVPVGSTHALPIGRTMIDEASILVGPTSNNGARRTLPSENLGRAELRP